MSLAQIDEKTAHEFINERRNINLDKILGYLQQENISTTSIFEENYPELLKEISNPPILLFHKGSLDMRNDHAISVVGTRKNTSYGKMAAEKLVHDLCKHNLLIVSGMAIGIDTIAHKTAIEANGRTIAVLGTGVDRKSIYPVSNINLSKIIVQSGGALISEFPPGTPGFKHNFPQRNRIISGLSLGTLVVEAQEKSGALITAYQALEQNREVFALPGSVFSGASVGPLNLIKKGAKLICNAEDIIETLNLKQITIHRQNKKILPQNKEEEIILSNLSHEPTHINQIVRLCCLSPQKTSSTLIIMEMKGMVKNIGGGFYVKIG